MSLPELEQWREEEELRGQSQDYMALGGSRGGRGDFRFKEGYQEREERKMSTQPAREAGKCWARMGRVRWNRGPLRPKWRQIHPVYKDPLKARWLDGASGSPLSRDEQSEGKETQTGKQHLTRSRGRAHPIPTTVPCAGQGKTNSE